MSWIWIAATVPIYLGSGIAIVGLIAGPHPISARGWFMVAVWPALLVAFVVICLVVLCMPPAKRKALGK